MRLDHIAYRVADRHKTSKFFIEAFGYRLAKGEGLTDGGFPIKFDDGSIAECLVLEPPEKFEFKDGTTHTGFTWVHTWNSVGGGFTYDFHIPPEIFISNGTPGSIVGRWVAERGGIGGIHHLAYQVEDVSAKMAEWKEKGYAEFTSEQPMTCPGLTQCFTKPSELTGVIIELIKRDKQGFCKENVKDLMISTDTKDK